MKRASIQFAVAALAVFLAAPQGLRADDPSPFGGASPFGSGLDEQKVRDDLAKMRQLIEQNQGSELQQKKDSRFHRWQGSGTKSSVRDKTRLPKNLSERSRDGRDSQRDRHDSQRDGRKRTPSRSSSRGSADTGHAS